MRRLIKILGQFRLDTIAFAVAYLLLSAVLELLTVLLVRVLFLMTLGPHSTAFTPNLLGFALPVGDHDRLWFFLGALLFVVLKAVLLSLLWARVLHLLAGEQAAFSRQMFERQLRAAYLNHLSRPMAAVQNDLTMAVVNVFTQLIVPAVSVISEFTIAATIFILLLIVSPVATLLVTFWLVVIIQIFRILTRRRAALDGTTASVAFEKMLSITQEGLAEFKLVKLWAKETVFGDLLFGASARFAHGLATDRLTAVLARNVFEPALIGGFVALYTIVTISGTSQPHLVAQLSLFAAAAVRFLPSAQRIAGQAHLLKFHQRSVDAVVAGLSGPIENLPDRPAIGREAPVQIAIELRNITLVYASEGKTVLSDLSLTIPRGAKIAIAGMSGAGKSSLLNVLLGFVPPTTGSILLDGRAQAPLARFRQTAIALVAQDFALLDDTIAANVTFGEMRGRDWREQVWKVLKSARIDEHIASLKDGIDTLVGKGGTILSGGERQRIALARAFYSNPSFLILDEALSQVDIETERLVIDDLLSRGPDFTMIMVGHRLESLERLPVCYRLSDGRLEPFVSARSYGPLPP